MQFIHGASLRCSGDFCVCKARAIRRFKSAKYPILRAVRDTAKGLHTAGVMDRVTLREFDQLCLPPVEPLQLEQIKHMSVRRFLPIV